MRAATPPSARRFLLGATIVTTIALGACGEDDDAAPTATLSTVAPSTPASSASDGSSASADFNDADVTFTQNMIAHHQQAIEMADIALDPARQAGPEVLDLAARVKAAQGPEIRTMTGWLQAWGQPVEMDMGGGDMSSMAGTMSEEEMDALATMTGAEFDDMWLTMMVEHHTGAIEMATAIQADGTNPEIRALAEQIVTDQQAEIEEMSTLLAA